MNGPNNTQRGLQQASAALEAAYNRIRQVRRSLLQFSETYPQNILVRETEDEALLLSGALEDELAGSGDYPLAMAGSHRMTQNSHEWTDETHTEPQLPQEEMIPPTYQDDNILAPSRQTSQNVFGLNSPITPLNFAQRRFLSESQTSRRRLPYHDEASTILGRRVAAREASRNAERVGSSISPSEGDSYLLPVGADRENDNLRDYLRLQGRHRRTEPSRLEPLPENSVSIPRDARSLDVNMLRRLQRLQSQEPSSADIPSVSISRRDSHRGSDVRLDSQLHSGRNSLSGQQSDRLDRLSLLSDFSVQNLATPVTSGSAGALFDEPVSYLPPRNNSSQIETVPEGIVGDVPPGRRYVVRRRLNADGEEHVYSINLEWSGDDPLSLLLPTRNRLQQSLPPDDLSRNPSQTQSDPPRASRFSSASSGSSHGWGRLDPDGIEVVPDDDEMPRNRTQYRSLPFRDLNMDPETGIISYPHPMQTGALHQPATAGDAHFVHEGNAPDGYNPGPIHESACMMEFSTSSLRVNPLPMPLSEMMPYSQKPRYGNHDWVIIAPKHASLAGR